MRSASQQRLILDIEIFAGYHDCMTDAEEGFATDNNWFGIRLRHLRKQRRLSQTELGELSDIHFSHISRYERGAAQPTADTLKRLAEALKVSVAHLVEDGDAPIEDPEIRQQLREIESLPEPDRLVVKRLLGAFLFEQRIKKISQTA